MSIYNCCQQEHNKSQQLEKKQKQIDKQITEWKSKYDGKEAELDQAKKETHMAGTEVTIATMVLLALCTYWNYLHV